MKTLHASIPIRLLIIFNLVAYGSYSQDASNKTDSKSPIQTAIESKQYLKANEKLSSQLNIIVGLCPGIRR